MRARGSGSMRACARASERLRERTMHTHCNNTLQHTAIHCNTPSERAIERAHDAHTLQHSATGYCNTPSEGAKERARVQHTDELGGTRSCSTRKSTIHTHCNSLQQHTAIHCNNTLQFTATTLQFTATTLQFTATTLQFTAITHCNTRAQHTAKYGRYCEYANEKSLGFNLFRLGFSLFLRKCGRYCEYAKEKSCIFDAQRGQ